MDSQGSVDDGEDVGGSQLEDTYRREDFTSVQDWLYCKRMVDPVWANEMEEEGPETEEAEARLMRRMREQKCIANATYQCGSGCL